MPTHTKSDRLLVIGEAAARLGRTVDTLRRWDAMPDETSPLKAVRVGGVGVRRYRESDVEALMTTSISAQPQPRLAALKNSAAS